jgi:hypothetical protein
MNRDWTPVRNGKYYCSPACGGHCTYEAFEKATKDAEALAQLCAKEIGGVWKPVVHENLGWHWHVVQEDTNIAIHKGGYLSEADYYTVGLGSGTPVQVSVHPQTFPTPKEAYLAQVVAIEKEADIWNDLLGAIISQVPTITLTI